MSKLIYTVVVEFQDKVVDDKEINEVAENMLRGLVSHANTSGLAPFDSETHTKFIAVAKDGVEVASETL
tara:strand:- start:160 stop:366 length:207 start_codon:yes stop_codon:yes gene_type:complete